MAGICINEAACQNIILIDKALYQAKFSKAGLSCVVGLPRC